MWGQAGAHVGARAKPGGWGGGAVRGQLVESGEGVAPGGRTKQTSGPRPSFPPETQQKGALVRAGSRGPGLQSQLCPDWPCDLGPVTRPHVVLSEDVGRRLVKSWVWNVSLQVLGILHREESENTQRSRKGKCQLSTQAPLLSKHCLGWFPPPTAGALGWHSPLQLMKRAPWGPARDTCSFGGSRGFSLSSV